MRFLRFQVTPGVSTTAYTASDVVGGLLTFTGLRGGTLVGVTVADKASQTNVRYILVLFESAPTSIADNANADIADADLAKVVFQWLIPYPEGAEHPPQGFSGVQAFADNALYYSYGMRYPIWSAGGSIYGFLILKDAALPTFAATNDITVSLLVEQG